MTKKQIVTLVIIIAAAIAILLSVFILVQSLQNNIDNPSPSDTGNNKPVNTNTVKRYYDFSELEKASLSPTVCKDKKTLFYLLNCKSQYFDLVDVQYKISNGYMSATDAKELGIDNRYTVLLVKLKVDENNINNDSYFSEERGLPSLFDMGKIESFGIDLSTIKFTGINFKDFNIDLGDDFLYLPYEIYWMTADNSVNSDFNVLIYATIPFSLEIDVQSILDSEQ